MVENQVDEPKTNNDETPKYKFGRKYGNIQCNKYQYKVTAMIKQELIQEKFCSVADILQREPRLSFLNKGLVYRLANNKLGELAKEKYSFIRIDKIDELVRDDREIENLENKLHTIATKLSKYSKE